MITDDGVAKITAFGLANMANRSKMTQLVTTMGAIAYMSPEQSHGRKVDGGEPLKVADYPKVRNNQSATLAWDSTVIIAGNVHSRIPDSGGAPDTLTRAKQEGERHVYPQLLPDSKSVLFTVRYEEAALSSYRLAGFEFGAEDYQGILDAE